jgi:hypothetical protein
MSKDILDVVAEFKRRMDELDIDVRSVELDEDGGRALAMAVSDSRALRYTVPLSGAEAQAGCELKLLGITFKWPAPLRWRDLPPRIGPLPWERSQGSLRP